MPRPPILVLLPPSEGKAEGGGGEPWSPGRSALPDLDGARAEVLAALDSTRSAGSGPPIAAAPTLPAIERYTGVLYRELDASSLGGWARRRLDERVLVASGLWGLVAPPDPIPTYRLKMGARLEPLGRLSTWWRPRLTDALADRVRGAVVWDLLPNEHAAALDWGRLEPRTRVTVRFLDAQGRTVSHWNKLLKGSLVRWLVESGESHPAAIVDFEHPLGYRPLSVPTRRASGLLELVLQEAGPA